MNIGIIVHTGKLLFLVVFNNFYIFIYLVLCNSHHSKLNVSGLPTLEKGNLHLILKSPPPPPPN